MNKKNSENVEATNQDNEENIAFEAIKYEVYDEF